MTSRTFFLCFIFSTIFVLAFLPTVDPDFFWHLKTGKLLLEGGFPQGDPYSFTKSGSPWHLHEWLSEVLMYKVYEVAGSQVLSLLFAFIIVFTFIIVYLRTNEKPYVSGIVTFIVAYVSSVSWGVRPQVFNMLFASIFIYILEGLRKGELNKKNYLLLFPLLVLWINLHSGAILGLVLIGIYVFLNHFYAHSKETQLSFISSIAVIFLAIFALLLSPHGYSSLIYPFETLSSEAMKAYINEWHSPDFHSDTGRPFYLLLISVFLIIMFSKVKPSMSEGILILGSLSQALMSYRNIPFFCICLGPYLSSALGDMLKNVPSIKHLIRPPDRSSPRGEKLVSAMLFLGFSIVCLMDIQSRIKLSDEAISKEFPTIAIDSLKEQLNSQTNPRVFNYYSWGGYLIWNDIPVFIDGRADMYGDEFFNRYASVATVKANASEILDEFNIDYVLYPTDSPLITFLKASGKYHLVHEDKLATILKRSS